MNQTEVSRKLIKVGQQEVIVLDAAAACAAVGGGANQMSHSSSQIFREISAGINCLRLHAMVLSFD
jgi:hypothetical protein